MPVLAESFIRFVYPFAFDPDAFHDHASQIAAADCGKLGPIWGQARFPENELLVHVARYLNPPDGTVPTALLWRMNPAVLQAPRGLGAGTRNPGANWYFRHGNDATTGFRIEDIQLALFHSGIGFLLVRVHPETEDLADWMDFLHYFRFLQRDRLRVGARRRIGVDPQTREPVTEPHVPGLMAGDGPPGDTEFCFGQLLAALLRAGTLPWKPESWWSDVFIANQWLPFASLFVSQLPESEQFPLLYRVHNFFHRDQGQHPAPQDLRTDQSHLLPYAERQWMVFSLDGGAFVACDPPQTPFFRETLPEHLDEAYVLTFLLALHQRFALMRFIERISRDWMGNDAAETAVERESLKLRRENLLRRAREALLAFTARGYFAQVMQRRHHHRCYLKWQEIFQVERLFHEVGSEVREMHDYLIMQDTQQLEQLAEESRHLESRLNWMAGLFAIPALVLAFFDAVGNVSISVISWASALGLLVGFFIMLGLQYRRKRRRGKPAG